MSSPPSPENIAAEYKRARFKGRPPSSWLDMLQKLRDAKRVPKEWMEIIDQAGRGPLLLEHLGQAAKVYCRDEHRWAAATGRNAMKTMPPSEFEHRRDAALLLGEARRKERDTKAAAIVEAFKQANAEIPNNVKPGALKVARWWVATNDPDRNVRSLTQSLRAARIRGADGKDMPLVT